ncbi:MAG: hypothetical protein SH808_01895 [Saprospiraceae bacterium]|nr:hypothetical protein [Saprospiraceae bacterium]
MSWRLRMFGGRLLHFGWRWPDRFLRLSRWTIWIQSPRGKDSFIRWFIGLILLIVDLTPLSLFYETIMDLVKSKSRALSVFEISIAQSVFRKSLPLHLISMDPTSMPVRSKKASAYVSFHTINYDYALPPHTFIHELMHVWQYERNGSVYISEALWAQYRGGGYNYGGLDPLVQYSRGKGLSAFNFEQQAEIIEDYYRWANGMPLQWVANVPGVGAVLEKYRGNLETESVGISAKYIS